MEVEEIGYVKIKWELEDSRSLSQNALFWKWCTEAALWRRKNGNPTAEKQTMHDLFVHLFLGYESKPLEVDRKEYSYLKRLHQADPDHYADPDVPRYELKKTSELPKNEMYHFMCQIDAWCHDKGCLLTIPDDSVYAEMKRKNQ